MDVHIPQSNRSSPLSPSEAQVRDNFFYTRVQFVFVGLRFYRLNIWVIGHA